MMIQKKFLGQFDKGSRLGNGRPYIGALKNINVDAKGSIYSYSLHIYSDCLSDISRLVFMIG